MSSGLTREVRRKARASAHAKHGRTCECGKTMHGNGWKAHARVCKPYLKIHGWPWAERERTYLMQDFRELAEDVHEAIRMLHRASIDEAVSRGLIARDEVVSQ